MISEHSVGTVAGAVRKDPVRTFLYSFSQIAAGVTETPPCKEKDKSRARV